jgi:DNA-binding GntR family transcriptional regulator
LLVTPPPGVAERLGVELADTVVCRRRVHSVDGLPHLLADSYLPAGLVHGTALARPDDVRAGDVLAGLGATETRHEMAVRAPSRAEIQALRLPAATAVLEHTSTAHTAGGQAVQVTVTIVPGDRNVVAYDVAAIR